MIVTKNNFMSDESAKQINNYIAAHTDLILYAYIFVYFIYLIFKTYHLNAFVFGDEWTCSYNSRHFLFSKTTENDVLYFLVYRLTNLWGTDFYEGARILNAFLI